MHITKRLNKINLYYISFIQDIDYKVLIIKYNYYKLNNKY